MHESMIEGTATEAITTDAAAEPHATVATMGESVRLRTESAVQDRQERTPATTPRHTGFSPELHAVAVAAGPRQG